MGSGDGAPRAAGTAYATQACGDDNGRQRRWYPGRRRHWTWTQATAAVADGGAPWPEPSPALDGDGGGVDQRIRLTSLTLRCLIHAMFSGDLDLHGATAPPSSLPYQRTSLPSYLCTSTNVTSSCSHAAATTPPRLACRHLPLPPLRRLAAWRGGRRPLGPPEFRARQHRRRRTRLRWHSSSSSSPIPTTTTPSSSSTATIP